MLLDSAVSAAVLSPHLVIIVLAVACIVTVVAASWMYTRQQRAMSGHEGASSLIAFGLVVILLATTGLLTAMTAPEAAPCVAGVFGGCTPRTPTATSAHRPPAGPLKRVTVQQQMNPSETEAYPELSVRLEQVDFSQGPQQTKWTLTLSNKGVSDCTGITFGQLVLVATTGAEKHTATPADSLAVALPSGAAGIRQTVTLAFADGFTPRTGGLTYTVALRVDVTSCLAQGSVTPSPLSGTPTAPAGTPTVPAGTPTAGPPVKQYNVYTLADLPL